MKTRVSDPMSGFFMFTRSFFERVVRRLSGRGFKILLDMMMSSTGPVAFAEIPYRMRSRHEGESKLNAGVVWDFLILLLHKTIGRLLPARFLSFAAVGFTGVFVHMLVLWLAWEFVSVPFIAAQAAATVVAMTGHFHSRGRSFSVNLFDGARASDELYRSRDWDEPPFTVLASPVKLAANAGLQYTCEFRNGTDAEVVFGPKVETDEHCNLFAYYYPADPGGTRYCF